MRAATFSPDDPVRSIQSLNLHVQVMGSLAFGLDTLSMDSETL